MSQFRHDDANIWWRDWVVGQPGYATVAPGEQLGKYLHIPRQTFALAPMPGGDVLLPTQSGTVGIERKHVDNLVSSWKTGELAEQLSIMLTAYDHVILLIEGADLASWFESYVGGDEDFARLRLDLLTFQEQGVRCLGTRDLYDTAFFVERLWQRYERTVHHGLEHPRQPQDNAVYRRMLMGVPGWGITTVTHALRRLGPPIRVFTASVEHLLEVPHISKRRAQMLFEAIGRKSNEEY